MKEIMYVLDKHNQTITDEDMPILDYIFRSLPGVRIVIENKDYIQFCADTKAMEAIAFLCDFDVLVVRKGTINDMK